MVIEEQRNNKISIQIYYPPVMTLSGVKRQIIIGKHILKSLPKDRAKVPTLSL
jgi:hypothetical protein